MSITKDFEKRTQEITLYGSCGPVESECFEDGAVLELLSHARALEAMLQEKLDQLSLAGDCIEKGLYNEALLHCRSHHRPAMELLEGTNQWS